MLALFSLCVISRRLHINLIHKNKIHSSCAVLDTFFTIVRLSLLTMIIPNQMREELLFLCSKMADETNLSSKLQGCR